MLSPIDRGPPLETPPDIHIGIRDKLRAWQKQLDTGPEVSTLHGFPASKSGSQQNLLGQAGTIDGLSSFVQDEDTSQNKFSFSTIVDDQVTDVDDDHTFLRQGDLVELL